MRSYVLEVVPLPKAPDYLAKESPGKPLSRRIRRKQTWV